MKYTDEEMVQEILKRSKKVQEERRKRASGILAGISAALFVALIAVIAVLPTRITGAYSEGTVYGAFLLGREAGGYVLTAVIAFVLGVTVTLFAMKRRGYVIMGR